MVNMGKIIIIQNNHPIYQLLIGSLTSINDKCIFVAMILIDFDTSNDLNFKRQTNFKIF